MEGFTQPQIYIIILALADLHVLSPLKGGTPICRSISRPTQKSLSEISQIRSMCVEITKTSFHLSLELKKYQTHHDYLRSLSKVFSLLRVFKRKKRDNYSFLSFLLPSLLDISGKVILKHPYNFPISVHHTDLRNLQ